VIFRNIFDECNFRCILDALMYFDVLNSDFLDDLGEHDVLNGTVSSGIGFYLRVYKIESVHTIPKTAYRFLIFFFFVVIRIFNNWF
jgi:hypothetical protein